MFFQMKYFIIKIIFHNFITDSEHHKLEEWCYRPALKGSSPNICVETNFKLDTSIRWTVHCWKRSWKKNMPHWWMHTISHTHHIVHGFWNCWKKMFQVWMISKLHGVNCVSIKEKTGKDAEELLNPRTLYDMMERMSEAILIKLKNVKNEFNGPFIEEYLCLVSYLFYSMYSWMEVIMKSLVSHYL